MKKAAYFLTPLFLTLFTALPAYADAAIPDKYDYVAPYGYDGIVIAVSVLVATIVILAVALLVRAFRKKKNDGDGKQ